MPAQVKKPEKLTDQQAATLARIRAAGGEVWRAYELKEAVRGIFQPGLSVEDVEILIDRLRSSLARCRLDPFGRLRCDPVGVVVGEVFVEVSSQAGEFGNEGAGEAGSPAFLEDGELDPLDTAV